MKISKRKIKIFFGVAAFVVTLFFSFHSLITVSLPTQENTTFIYSNDDYDDLSNVSLAALRSARSSIVMSIYALGDKNIIKALNEQAEKGIDLYLVCDAEASKKVFRRLNKKIQVVKRAGKGLMHHKLFVIDGLTTWMSSANMTRNSLHTAGNLMVGVYNENLASYVSSMIRKMDAGEASKDFAASRLFNLQEQKLTFSFLPEDSQGINKVLSMIRAAKKTIKVAMYAWTRYDVTKALVEAHQRGVDVQVVIDRSMALGMAKKVIEEMRAGGLSPRMSEGDPLLHYKMMIVDDERLLSGSANWTMAAFKKNDDYFMTLYPLNLEQKEKIRKIWDSIFYNSSVAL